MEVGNFLFNPDDSQLFVPKRFGIGYPLNFANPWSWAILAVILFAIGLPLTFGFYMLRAVRRRVTH